MVQKSTKRGVHWDDLRFFLEVARQGSLTAAARRLRVEHSTVARRIASLERDLGLKLFDRLKGGWRLTSEGEGLVPQAQRLEEEVLTLERMALGAGTLRGTVRLSAPPVLAAQFIAPRLAALHAHAPGIDLEIVSEARDANLSSREADLAIRLSRPEAPGLVTRSLAELGFGLFAARDYGGRPAEAREFIGYDETLAHVPQQQWLQEIAGERRFVLRANDLHAVHRACRAGLGIAALPLFLGCEDAALERMDEPVAAPRRGIWLVMQSDVRRSPRVRAVADFLTGLFETHADFLAG